MVETRHGPRPWCSERASDAALQRARARPACNRHKPKYDVANPQFLGTSGVRTVFSIQVKRGVDIVRYSIFQGEDSEAEVLIYPGTKLRVVDSMHMGSGLFMVHLEEIEIPTELIK